MTAPSLLSLDLATSVGWARLRDGRVDYGTYRLPATGPDVGRFLAAYEDWLRVAMLDGVDVCVFEAPFVSGKTSQDTARKLLCLAGLTELICHRAGIRCFETNIKTVTKHFVGRCPPQRAEKKAATLRACRQRGWQPKNDDEADALAVLDYAVHWLRLPVKLPVGGLFGDAA